MTAPARPVPDSSPSSRSPGPSPLARQSAPTEDVWEVLREVRAIGLGMLKVMDSAASRPANVTLWHPAPWNVRCGRVCWLLLDGSHLKPAVARALGHRAAVLEDHACYLDDVTACGSNALSHASHRYARVGQSTEHLVVEVHRALLRHEKGPGVPLRVATKLGRAFGLVRTDASDGTLAPTPRARALAGLAGRILAGPSNGGNA